MSLVVNGKFICIACFIFMYNIWLNIVGYLTYSTYKVVEYYLEILVRGWFGVEEHASEIIVFYFLACCVLVCLWFFSPYIYRYFSKISKCYQQQFLIFWGTLIFLDKIKAFLLYSFTSFSFIFLMF